MPEMDLDQVELDVTKTIGFYVLFDLQFNLIAIRILVVGRQRHSVIDGPVRRYSRVTQFFVLVEQVANRGKREGHVFNADLGTGLRYEMGNLHDREPMVFLVVRKKRQEVVAVSNAGTE